MSRIVEVIDIFCGAGGLTRGLLDSGISVVAGLDIDSHCKYPYEKNNNVKFINADIKNYSFKKLKKLYSKKSIKILVGCAPCQPFSSLVGGAKKPSDNDLWGLIADFGAAVEAISPDIISVENVRRFANHDVYDKFIQLLIKNGYDCTTEVVHCPNYGIPQSRNRLVLLASRYGEIRLQQPTHSKKEYVTVKDVIKPLTRLKAGDTCKTDKLHRCRALSDKNLERIKASKPHGTWRDWNKALLPLCYKRKSGESFSSVYGRMGWDKVAPTITTQFYSYGSGRFGHPTQHRALSLREGALLQTFPFDYDFGPDIKLGHTGRLIGNAVPPKLGEAIGRSILNHIEARKK